MSRSPPRVSRAAVIRAASSSGVAKVYESGRGVCSRSIAHPRKQNLDKSKQSPWFESGCSRRGQPGRPARGCRPRIRSTELLLPETPGSGKASIPLIRAQASRRVDEMLRHCRCERSPTRQHDSDWPGLLPIQRPRRSDHLCRQGPEHPQPIV